ncbi:MAG: hypothetical protein V4538_14910 [Bacteroidota bacterium]
MAVKFKIKNNCNHYPIMRYKDEVLYIVCMFCEKELNKDGTLKTEDIDCEIVTTKQITNEKSKRQG